MICFSIFNNHYPSLTLTSLPDIFILCFSITTPASFENIKSKWYTEISKHAPGTPFILVGTKLDTRGDEEVINHLVAKRQAPVTKSKGVDLCTELKGFKYIECSSLTQEGLKQVFDEAIRCVLIKRHTSTLKKKKACIIL